MSPKKSKESPPPSRRASALSDSANQFSSGPSSAWQSAINNSPRMASVNQRSQESPRARASHADAAEQEGSTRHMGTRSVTKAIGVRTQRKYSLFGIRFGPKQHVFDTETLDLPVYQETDSEKRYYSVTRRENAESIGQNGFQTAFGGNGTGQALAPTNTAQYNSRGHIYFFNNESNARVYGKTNLGSDYALVEFTMPEDHEFTPDPEAGFNAKTLSKTQAMRTAQSIPANYIKSIKTGGKK